MPPPEVFSVTSPFISYTIVMFVFIPLSCNAMAAVSITIRNFSRRMNNEERTSCVWYMAVD
jgi:hypothetical protein